jgi:hypothetical protein
VEDLHDRLAALTDAGARWYASVWGRLGTTAETDGLNNRFAVLIALVRHRQSTNPLLASNWRPGWAR